MSLAEKLAAGLEGLNLDLDAAMQRRLLEYVALLHKWNRVHNLTAVREPQKMLYQHVLDSLAVLPHLAAAKSLADVGSGAGLPGIPLALARPDLAVTLIDSSHKKAAFLRQACALLPLPNAAVVCARAEGWRPAEKFDAVISRAFSDLAEFVQLAGHLCAPGGVLLAMKGVYPYDELAQLPPQAWTARVVPLHVPGLEAQRHLIIIRAGQD